MSGLCGSWRFCDTRVSRDTRVSLSRSESASFSAFTLNKPIPFDLDVLLLPFPPLSLFLSSMDKECTKAPLCVVLHLQRSSVPFECGPSQSFATCLPYCVPGLLVVPCQICQDLAIMGLCTCVCFCMSVCACVRACVRAKVCARVSVCVSTYVRLCLPVAFCSAYSRFLQCLSLSLSAVHLSLAFCSVYSHFLQCVLSFSAVSLSRFLQPLLSLSAVCTCAHKRSLPFSLPSFHPSIPPHLLTLPTPRAGNVDVGGHNTTSSTDKV